jgi:hypothetical protein
MTNAEEAIDKLLTGLRKTGTPAGMEARILLALDGALKDAPDAHTLRRSSRGSWRDWLAMRDYARPLAGGVAMAGLSVLAALVVSMHRADHAAVNRRDVRVPASFSTPAVADAALPKRLKPDDAEGGFPTAEAVPLSDMPRSLNLAAEVRTRSGDATPSPTEISGAEGPTDYAALAVSEMLAPSKPAPPLPLTHQEKLLAQVVRTGDPEQLADLKPDVREKQVELAKAEFQNFFEPPPAKDNE